ncbi:XrtA/PEP-CTERM system TPR-repeat protein PrsT [Neptunomonas marina]|uniref:XrtA/PEP-CTERM system TPR-repeat protein PrsT n=1 Tax=Neptunomonas marina TaxID=1815562 RepID=UPI0013E37E87|nr:XrtA/PEP-CTERM system TPR-repeat protein PrsT [Neptunomonas marina]
MFRKKALAVALAALLSSSVSGANQADVANYYEDANRLFYSDDLPGAMIQLKNALQLNPKHLPSLLLSGDILLKEGDAAAAEYTLRQAQEFGADPSLLVINLAESYLQQGKYRALVEDINADDISPTERVPLLGYQAEALTVLGKFTDAHLKIEYALSLENNALLPSLAEVALLLKEGKRTDAQEKAKQLLMQYPDDPRAWNSLASTLHASGRLSEALKAYSKALELDRAHVDARVAKIGILVDLDRKDDARAELDVLKEVAEHEPRGAYFRGLLLEDENETESKESYQLAAQIIDAVPEQRLKLDARLLMLGALSHYALAQLEEARSYLELYLRRNTTDVGARKLLGDVLLKQDVPEEAIRVLQAARAYASRDPAYLSLLAAAYSATGRDTQAASILEEAVGLSRNLNLQTQLAQSRIKAGKSVAEDIERLQSLYEKNPSHQSGVVLLVHYLNEGLIDQAQAIGKTLVANSPDNATYQNLYGVSLLAAGQLSAARQQFEHLLSITPAFLPAKINIAKIDTLEGQLLQARESLLALNQAEPENVKVALELARVEEADGNIAEARKWAERATSMQSGYLEASLYLADILVALKAYEEAESAIRAAVHANGNSLEAKSALAQIQFIQQKNKAGLTTLKTMVKDAGFDIDALYKIARLQLRAGSIKDAQYSLAKILQVDSQNYQALVLITELQSKQGLFNDAQTSLDQLRAAYPQNPVSAKLQGDLFLAQGRLPEAETAYREGLALQPVDSLAVSLVRTLQQQGRIDDALSEAAKWRDTMPDSLILKATESELLLHKQNYRGAVVLLAELLKAQPDNVSLLNNMAYALSHLNVGEALKFAKHAYGLAPENPLVTDTYGWLLVKNGDREEGLRYLREAVARAANRPEILYHLSSVLAELGRDAEAKRYIVKALASDLPFSERHKAEKLKEHLFE